MNEIDTAMTPSLQRIAAELESLEYTTDVFEHERGPVVRFDYRVETGTHEGETFKMGVCMWDVAGEYPEFAPHWLHVSPPVDDNLGGAAERYQDRQGREWIAMSRPVGPLWDDLPEKNMAHYLTEHIRRFWAGT